MAAPEPPKRVLVIDDDQSIVETLQTALRHAGYHVLVARDGAEGLMRAERDAPDLIILDVVMPRRSGFSILERLRYFRETTPIIIVTGNEEPRHREFAESRGASAFLNKPFAIDDLLATVKKLLKV